MTVTTPTGTSQTGAADRFTYLALRKVPEILRLIPHAGRAWSRTRVLVRGKNLAGATRVTFGGRRSPFIRVLSDHALLAVTPALRPGTVDVRVASPSATSLRKERDRFTFTRRIRHREPHPGSATPVIAHNSSTICLCGAGIAFAALDRAQPSRATSRLKEECVAARARSLLHIWRLATKATDEQAHCWTMFRGIAS